MLLLLELQFRLARNIIRQLSLSNRVLVIAGIVFFLYFSVVSSGLLHAVMAMLTYKKHESLEAVFLSLHTLVFFVGAAASLLYSGRYTSSLHAKSLTVLPFCRAELFFTMLLAELLNPVLLCVIAVLLVTTVPVLSLSTSSNIQLTFLLAVVALFYLCSIRLFMSVIDFVNRDPVQLASSWVCALLLLSYAVWKALSVLTAVAGAHQGSPFLCQDGLRWLYYTPPGIVTKTIFDLHRGVASPWRFSLMLAMVASICFLIWRMDRKSLGEPAKWNELRQIHRLRQRLTRSFRIIPEHMNVLTWKDLLYYSRCNRTRIAFLSGIVMYIMLDSPNSTMSANRSVSWHMGSAVISAMSALLMVCNAFAYEGSGLSNYMTLPIGKGDILKTKIWSSILITGLMLALVLLVNCLFWPMRVPQMFLLLSSLVIPITWLSISIGLGLSMWYPMGVAFESIASQSAPVQSTLIMMVVAAALVAPVAVLEETFCPARELLFYSSTVALATIECFGAAMMVRVDLKLWPRAWSRIYSALS